VNTLANSTAREIVRKYVGSFLFHVFNWTFISFMQSILLFLLAAPVYTILLSTQFDPEVQTSDVAFAALNIGLVIWEVFADQQQWSKLIPPLRQQMSDCRILTVSLQISRMQRRNIKRRPRFHPDIHSRNSTVASSPRVSGDIADTPTLRLSRASGSSSISGAATPQSRYTTGPLSAPHSWS
jgi:hypothetical protein